jgi:hypothetical protein
MPKFLNEAELGGYYSGRGYSKSIQLSHKFYVTFIEDPVRNFRLAPDIGIMPIIKNWHVLNVTVPTYNFKKEIQKYGPMVKSIPVMDYNGFEIKVTFEEDGLGTISYLINWLQ